MIVNIMLTVEELQEFLSLQPAKPATKPAAESGQSLMKMSSSVRRDVMREIGDREPESGGVLIGPKNEPIATHFVFDDTGICTGTSWTFGHARLNEILKKYVPLGLDAKGYIHSHPAGFRQLSSGDLVIPQKAFANPKNEDLNEVWMPIIVDGELLPFIVYRKSPKKPEPAKLILI